MEVSFLGLGAIGTPMAARISDRANLVVWNRTSSKARAFAGAHRARAATSPQDAARSAEVLMTCLPTSADVDAVLFGADGAADALASGSVVVDCTSGDPETSRSIAERLSTQNVAFLDAPVSGGTFGAESGTLTTMVGGDAQVLERIRQVLEMFSQRIVHCGPVGSGDAVKAMNNAMLAVHIWSLAEALAALQKMGVRPEVALEVINTSSGRSNSSMNLFPQRVLDRSFPRTFRLALLDKDVRIAAQIAHAAGTPSDLLDETSALFTGACKELGEEADHIEAVKVVERRAGVAIGRD